VFSQQQRCTNLRFRPLAGVVGEWWIYIEQYRHTYRTLENLWVEWALRRHPTLAQLRRWSLKEPHEHTAERKSPPFPWPLSRDLVVLTGGLVYGLLWLFIVFVDEGPLHKVSWTTF